MDVQWPKHITCKARFGGELVYHDGGDVLGMHCRGAIHSACTPCLRTNKAGPSNSLLMQCMTVWQHRHIVKAKSGSLRARAEDICAFSQYGMGKGGSASRRPSGGCGHRAKNKVGLRRRSSSWGLGTYTVSDAVRGTTRLSPQGRRPMYTPPHEYTPFVTPPPSSSFRTPFSFGL